jgi:hypothetical protein
MRVGYVSRFLIGVLAVTLVGCGARSHSAAKSGRCQSWYKLELVSTAELKGATLDACRRFIGLPRITGVASARAVAERCNSISPMHGPDCVGVQEALCDDAMRRRVFARYYDCQIPPPELRRHPIADLPLTVRLTAGWNFNGSNLYAQKGVSSLNSRDSLHAEVGAMDIVFRRQPTRVWDARKHTGARLRSSFADWVTQNPLVESTSPAPIQLGVVRGVVVHARAKANDPAAYAAEYCGASNSKAPCLPFTVDQGPEGFVSLAVTAHQWFSVISFPTRRGPGLIVIYEPPRADERRRLRAAAMRALSTLRNR